MVGPRHFALLAIGLLLVGAAAGTTASAASMPVSLKVHPPTARVALIGMPRRVGAGSTVLIGTDVPRRSMCSLVATLGRRHLQTPEHSVNTTHAEWSWTVPKTAGSLKWHVAIKCATAKTKHDRSRLVTAAAVLAVRGPRGAHGPLFIVSRVSFTALAGSPFVPGKGVGTPPTFGVLELAGSSWLDGHGVNIYSNSANWEHDSGVWNYVNGKLSGERWQCVEMIDRLILTLGWAPSGISGNAIDFWANAPSAYFVQHPNGSGAVPAPGDIVVFHDTTGRNRYGHVAVVNTVNSGSVTVAEQNASASGLTTLAWNGSTLGGEGTEIPIGWLHPKADNIGATQPPPKQGPPNQVLPPQNAPPPGTYAETVGGPTNTWTNATTAGGSAGPQIAAYTAVAVSCRTTGFAVADGNTWWYLIASSPWNDSYYASADAFYNDGSTSGSLQNTPFVDNTVPACAGSKAPTITTTTSTTSTTTSTTTTTTTLAPPPPPHSAPTYSETPGGVTHTWTDYVNAGGTEGPSLSSGQTIQVSCKVAGFQVADGDTWWYRIASSPWSGSYYASADAFYNDGATSGSLLGTPFVDNSVPSC